MIEVTTTIVGAAEVAQRFTNAGPLLRPRLLRAVHAAGISVLRVAKEKVSDDMLHVRSGKLRRSLHEETTDSGDVIESTVGTDLVYARAQDLGFRGTEQVRAHTRTTAKGVSQVRAFSRTMSIPPHPFLETALAERKDAILASFAAVAAEGP